MQLRGRGGQRERPGRGAPGAGSTSAQLGRFAGCCLGLGANRAAALPFGTEFRTGKRVGLTHLRNSVPKVAETRCKGLITNAKGLHALPCETQFRTGRKLRGNHPANSVRRVAGWRWLCGLCWTGPRRAQALGRVAPVPGARVSSPAAATAGRREPKWPPSACVSFASEGQIGAAAGEDTRAPSRRRSDLGLGQHAPWPATQPGSQK